jgi:uncharacterized protein
MPDIIVNTSPLQYLHQLACLDWLAQMYGSVLVPEAVARELEQGAKLGIDLPKVDNLRVKERGQRVLCRLAPRS